MLCFVTIMDGVLGQMTYDDGIERAIVLVKAYQPKFPGVADESFIDAAFRLLIEALKAEKSDAVV